MKSKLLLFMILMAAFVARAQEKVEPEFKEVYFVNRANERVTEVRISDKFVYMVIETLNANGEDITIELEEEDGEFLYRKKYLGPGVSVEFKVKKDIEKLKFRVFNPKNKKHVRLKEDVKPGTVLPEDAIESVSRP